MAEPKAEPRVPPTADEGDDRKVAHDVLDESVRAARDADRAERQLGRAVALGLPVVTVVAAILVGFVASVGSALLILAAGVLLGTIALLWASVRTLSGDAPLPLELETLAAGNRRIDDLAEQKRRVLRSLKDLENEHAIQKIDDEDYEQMAARYREEAKVLMREMDKNVAPAVAEAERIVTAYFGTLGLAPMAKPGAAGVTEPPAVKKKDTAAGRPLERERVVCSACTTSNEPDAAFCKKCGGGLQTSSARDGNEKAEASEASEDDATT